jgi:hypothetical protein
MMDLMVRNDCLYVSTTINFTLDMLPYNKLSVPKNKNNRSKVYDG